MKPRGRRGLGIRRSKKAGMPPGALVHIGPEPPEKTRIVVIDYDEAGVREHETESIDECAAYCHRPTVTWVNFDGLQDVELLKRIGETFALHPLVLEDILNTDQRPKVEDYGDYLYVVLKMLSHDGDAVVAEQVSIILGKTYVLSFQESGKPGDVFDSIRNRIRSGAGKMRKMGPDFLAYSLVDAVVDNYFVVLERLADGIEALDQDLIEAPTPDTVNRVYRFRTETLFLRKSVWPLREMASGLHRGESPLISNVTRLYLRDVYDHTIHVIDTLETLRDMLSSMLDIYLSSVSYRMNEVMKVLTIIATIFIPLTFLVGVYGMNFDYMPELHWHWAYPALWAIMVVIALAMVSYFKRRGWM